MTVSKIKLFFIFCVTVLTAASCNKKNDVIPDVTVDFYLDITDARFIDLNAIGGSVLVNSSTNNDRYASGYQGSGIIVSRGVDEFFAYDRTCPHDYTLDGSVVRIEIDPTGFAKAVCPKCKSTFELISYGTPASGVSQYPLKNYRTSFDGRYIRVWNN
ncbi:MAG TPA: hypothetical protein VK207_04210 [Bacteroidales bacterium]|jgi:nitrite reductase/ring-hydroxylating ferredoxin subunit|nr:hypothetical protein [Bacteroidales bacterium]